jgi:hypothetical protein
MTAHSTRTASSTSTTATQQAFGGASSRDLMSDRTFAVTLAAMLLAVIALPFAPAADLASELPVGQVAAQLQPAAPAATAPVLTAPALEPVVITGHRRVQQAQAASNQAASRS